MGENPTPYGNLALWAVNGLSIVCWGIILCAIGPCITMFKIIALNRVQKLAPFGQFLSDFDKLFFVFLGFSSCMQLL